MDLYFNLAVNVLLQVLDDRSTPQKFFRALAKLHVRLENLETVSTVYAKVVGDKREQS